MALVADQLDAFPVAASSSPPSPQSITSNHLADAAKQATKALKCVAFTTKQVGELLARKHERVLKRIGAISEEIESLKADVMENIAHQRERREQLSEIEDDVEHAQLLGNGAVVETLYDELHVVKEETKREEALYRALCKTVRRRKDAKKQFQHERLLVEEEIRTFSQKQKLIQTLLASCSKQSATSAIDYTLASSASQSDCGASVLVDNDDADQHEDSDDSGDSGSSSSGSFPENLLLDSPPLRAASPTAAVPDRKVAMLAKAMSLVESGEASTPVRVRSWSSDCVQPLPAPLRESVHTRARHSLSVHFASPVLTVSTIQTNDEQLDRELESLDLSHYLSTVNETTSAPPPMAVAIVCEDATEPITQVEETTQTDAPRAEATLVEVADVVEHLVVETEAKAETVESSVTTLEAEETPAPASATDAAPLAA